ncbi:MAG: HIT family protein [Gaiellaceae bacterium]
MTGVRCLACDVNAGRVPAPGGVILDTGRWRVDHTVGSLGLGTLVVKPLRHVLSVGDLDSRESAELGPVLQWVAATVAAITRPSQVYVCLWSHERGEPGHIHFVVQPVTDALLAAHGARGPALQAALFARGEPPDPEAAAAFAEQARDLLQG